MRIALFRLHLFSRVDLFVTLKRDIKANSSNTFLQGGKESGDGQRSLNGKRGCAPPFFPPPPPEQSDPGREKEGSRLCKSTLTNKSPEELFERRSGSALCRRGRR